MKKIILLLLLTPIFALPVLSQEEETPTPTVPSGPTPTKGVTDKIQELKERVANRVAALKKEKLTGLSGVVKSSSDSALILIVEGAQYSIQLDEEAKVYSVDTNLRKKEVKLSSIEKDSAATVIGTVDKDEKTATVELVIAKQPNAAIFGTVSEVSTKDGTITVSSYDSKKYTVDIEVSTKSNQFNPESGELTKIGLSKIEKDSRIHVYGVLGEEENRLTGLRVLILPKNLSAMPKPSPTSPTSPTSTPTPSETE